MKGLNKKNNIKIIVLFVLLGILVFSYGLFFTIKYLKVFNDNNVILNNIYLEEIDLSNLDYDEAEKRINYYSDSILSKKINLSFNDNKIETDFKELGFTIDLDATINSIKDYQKYLNYNERLKLSNNKNKKIFNVLYKSNEEKIILYLKDIKSKYDIKPVNGYFDTNNGVKFVKGVNGYSLNVEKNINLIKNIANKSNVNTVELLADITKGNNNESYESIDTKVSSFTTYFNQWEGTRPTNLRTALGYINGVVVEPGEVFSFYKYAGPFNKTGYVFYYEFVGNGVCQIATTCYNAALLGGLQIVKRYPHAKQSKYVDGGLDATVASYSSGWYVDMQWKNTYKYPIYIKAYPNGGSATVELWSNSNAKEGKTYSTESVQIGTRGFQSYLHTFKDGVELSKDLIATTWYTES